MNFNNSIYIICFIWCGYYLLVILFDVLKSTHQPDEIATHHVHFESQNPVLINDESISTNHLANNDEKSHSHKDYLPKDNSNDLKTEDKKKWVTVDMGLETISGEAYEVSAENLSKYMKV